MNRDIIHTNSTCKVELFHYINSDVVEDINPASLNEHSTTMSVKQETIRDAVIECNLSKNISNFRGTFDLLFKPTKNWKKKIRPGDWLVIYLGIDGEETPRMLGNVDRVSRIVNVNEKGIKTILYKISGSNFGKVFDKYNVFWNPYLKNAQIEKVIINSDSIQFIGSPDEVVKDLINIFLGYGRKRSGNQEYKELNQWFIPNELAELFPAFAAPTTFSDKNPYLGSRFFDILNIDIRKVEGKKYWNNIGSMQGTLAELIKRSSNDMINEVFLELEYDKTEKKYRPTIKMRMIPFAKESYNFGASIIYSEATVFMELDEIKVPITQVLNEDLGENDHTRFNLFFLGSQVPFTTGKAIMAPTSEGVNPKYPRPLKDSMKRNGLIAKWETTDFNYLTSNPVGDNLSLLKDWNNLLFHWYKEDFKYETGSMTVVGNPDIKLGKRLVIEDTVLGDGNRHYYIEGYTDNWSFPNRWVTSLQLTRGQGDNERPLFENQTEETDEIGITSVKEGFHKANKKSDK